MCSQFLLKQCAKGLDIGPLRLHLKVRECTTAEDSAVQIRHVDLPLWPGKNLFL